MCVCVCYCAPFLTLDRLTVSFKKLYNTDLILSKTQFKYFTE